MKIQIRRGVFETNSSSTHSLQITSKNLDAIYDDVMERIRKSYGENSYNNNKIVPEDFINGDIFYLEGFDMESGDEEKHVYYIIKSWIGKLQYIAMHLWENLQECPEFSKCYSDRWNVNIKSEVVSKWETPNAFLGFVKEFLATKGIVVKDVKFDDGDMCSPHWVEYVYADGQPVKMEFFEDNEIRDVKKFIKKVKEYMEDGIIIVDADEAYHPWSGPIIKEI